MFDANDTPAKQQKTIILLKVSKFCHNGSNTARLNLKIDRFQVNNEYLRDGMRTEQIHIEILNHISHTCKIMCTKKHNSAEG
jgi:hypothetical protein